MLARIYGLVLVLSVVMWGCAAEEEEVSSDSAALTSTCGVDPTKASAPRALLDRPFRDDADAERRLTCLSTILDTQSSHRALFPTLYTNTTRRVREGIAAGRMNDPGYSSRLLTRFAELYRVAFVAYEDGEDVPAAWRIAFDAAKESDQARRSGKPDNVLALQHTALGVNAHVNHDLAHAVADVGLEGGSISHRKHDYDVVRSILLENVDASLDLVTRKYAAGLGQAPETLKRALGDSFTVWLVVGREKAWADALLLMRHGLTAKLTNAEVELLSKEMGEALLAGNGISPSLMAKLKRLEGSR